MLNITEYLSSHNSTNRRNQPVPAIEMRLSHEFPSFLFFDSLSRKDIARYVNLPLVLRCWHDLEVFVGSGKEALYSVLFRRLIVAGTFVHAVSISKSATLMHFDKHKVKPCVGKEPSLSHAHVHNVASSVCTFFELGISIDIGIRPSHHFHANYFRDFFRDERDKTRKYHTVSLRIVQLKGISFHPLSVSKPTIRPCSIPLLTVNAPDFFNVCMYVDPPLIKGPTRSW